MIVRLTGGLGNQMFQYAFGLATAQERDEILYIDTFAYVWDRKRSYVLDQLNVNAKKLNILKQLKYNFIILFCKKKQEKFEYEHVLFTKQDSNRDNEYFFGCWQNVAYFKEIKEQLLGIYTFQCKNVDVNRMADEISHVDSVAIHVRRGDYAQLNNIYVIQSIQYYMDAMKYIEDRINLPQYYFFSDDINWCRDKFKGMDNLHFITGNSTVEDYWLMLRCKHHVIANSTFSWWPAWFSCDDESSINIAPKYWLKDINTNQRVKKAILDDFVLL